MYIDMSDSWSSMCEPRKGFNKEKNTNNGVLIV